MTSSRTRARRRQAKFQAQHNRTTAPAKTPDIEPPMSQADIAKLPDAESSSPDHAYIWLKPADSKKPDIFMGYYPDIDELKFAFVDFCDMYQLNPPEQNSMYETTEQDTIRKLGIYRQTTLDDCSHAWRIAECLHDSIDLECTKCGIVQYWTNIPKDPAPDYETEPQPLMTWRLDTDSGKEPGAVVI